MKNIFNKYIIVGGLTLATVLGSCSKEFLDKEPYTDIPAEEALSNVSNLQGAINGVYNRLIQTSAYGRTIPVFGDAFADNVFVSAANSGRYTYTRTYSATVNNADIAGVWTNAYQGILACNNIIDATVTGDAVNVIKGQAYALRALNYFNLVRLFARPYTDNPAGLGVPLSLHYDPFALPTRSTVAQVYTQITADLEQAYNLLGDYDGGSARISKYAARALASKVYLYTANYQKAAEYANEVITSSGYSLLPRTAIAGYWAEQGPRAIGNRVETLFEVSSDNINNNSYDELVNIYVQGAATYGDLLVPESFYNLYPTTDARKALIIPGARNRDGGEDPAYFVNKYSNAGGNYGPKKIIRLSEVYLIAAEAGARLGQATGLTRLNQLMAQRDPSLVYASTGAQLITNIINERRKELAFEGDRFFDLNRLQLPINRSTDYPASGRTLAYSSPKRVLPIPQSEINVNPNITQNPL